MKYVIDLLAPALKHILNVAIETSVFPKQMQKAKVLVLHKNGEKDDIRNYRPILILPVVSNVLEKVLLRRLTYFSGKKNT